MKQYTIALPIALAMMVAGCSKKSTSDIVQTDSPTVKPSVTTQRPKQTAKRISDKTVKVVRPPRLIYRMSGDYADLVPVTLNEKGELKFFPDPVDVREATKPVPLGDGWYLDRRGISSSTAFTDYTYEQYHALPKVPSADTLKAHIIARNAITTIWSCGNQQRTIEQYKQLVADGFPDCTCILADK